MKFWNKIYVVMLASTLALSASAETTAIINATIAPMDEARVLENHTIIIEGDRIIAVGPADETPAPAGATIIDGENRFVVPGYTEMHAHIPGEGSQYEPEDVLFLYIAGGVTTARGMLGAPGQHELRDRTMAGEIVGPTLYLAAPALSGNAASTPEDGARLVREAVGAGYDLLKIHEGLSRETYDAIATEAQALGIPYGGHVPDDVGVEHALERGQRTIEHLDNYLAEMGAEETPATDSAINEMAEKTAASQTGTVPTMALWEHLFVDPETLTAHEELKYVPPALIANWTRVIQGFFDQSKDNPEGGVAHLENRRRLLLAISTAGGEILAGSDAPQIFSVPGFSIHREMMAMARAELTPYEVLYSATAAPGDYFESEDAFGRIAPGQRADLVVLRANPLEDIENTDEIEGVMVRGDWKSKQYIDTRLKEIAQKYAE